jgi:L-alanine-DL-glutamate epimerase-like enolase superfamily enzyme
MAGSVVSAVEVIVLEVPLTPHQEKILPFTHREYGVQHLLKVTLASGVVGWGEGSSYSGLSTEAAQQKVVGTPAAASMWDDSIGTNLQMALFDAVGKELGVPVHALIPGPKVRDWAPLSWWCHSNSPAEWVVEAKLATAAGYTTCKYKARPWWDVIEQVEAVTAVVSEDFKMDLDFNMTLCDAANALPVLKKLEAFPNIAMIESPIPQEDIKGNARLREACSKPIAMHFGSPNFLDTMATPICDAYVVGGGAKRLVQQDALAGEANVPFWLQLVGSGITTTWAAHFAAKLKGASWPSITCMNILSHQLITEPIDMIGGFFKIPNAPGLGITVSEEAVARFRVPAGDPRTIPTAGFYSDSRVLYTVVYPDGGCIRYKGDIRGYFVDGHAPAYAKGTRLEQWEDDGSARWQESFDEVAGGPVRARYPGPRL